MTAGCRGPTAGHRPPIQIGDVGAGGPKLLLDPQGAVLQLLELIRLAGDAAEVAELIDGGVKSLVDERIKGGKV
jgi:hypothetical protein